MIYLLFYNMMNNIIYLLLMRWEKEEQNENQVHTRGWVGVVVACICIPVGYGPTWDSHVGAWSTGCWCSAPSRRLGRWETCTIKRRTIFHTRQAREGPDGFNDVISYAVYHYQFKKHLMTRLTKGPTLAEQGQTSRAVAKWFRFVEKVRLPVFKSES